jgi:DNA-binding GntR family transcriptional regulator
VNGLKGPSSGPQYRKLADRILASIQSGVHPDGEPLILEGDLFSEFSHRPAVIRRALAFLEMRGWVTKSRDGVWVASLPRSIHGTLLVWDPSGTSPDGYAETQVRVLSKIATTLPADFLKYFELHGVEGKRASKIVKVYLGPNRPVALETIVSPTSQAPGLVMKDHRHISIYKILELEYSAKISHIKQHVYCRSTTEEEALALGLRSPSPVLALDRVVFSGLSGIALIRFVFADPQRGFSDEAQTCQGPIGISG